MIFSFKIQFFLILFKLCLSSIYKIPFGLYNIKKANNKDDIVYNTFFSIIYVNLSIGTPPQNTPFGLSFGSQTFTINNKNFDKNKSSTFEEISNYENNDDDDIDIVSGIYSKDILNINNNKEKVNFIFADKLKNEEYPFGIIVLLIPNNIDYIYSKYYPFFNSLKEAKLINSFTWTLKYFNNISLLNTINEYSKENKIIGEFIFGNDPHNYEDDKSRYNKSQLIRINPLSSYDCKWEINFNNIYILYHKNETLGINETQKINIQLSGRTKIIPEAGFIFMPKEFDYMIKKRFFNDYLKEKICNYRYINDTIYDYIECDNNSLFNIYSFPDLCFEHKDFETTFNFTYEDLFVYDKHRNKYIFLMLSDKYLSGWIFGTIFLRKYQLIFNQDSKTIGYYKSMNYVCDNKKNNNNNSNIEIMKFIFIGILLLISSFLLFLIGMYIQKNYCNKNKKMKANELVDEESFGYENDNNKINKEILLSENSKTKTDINSINDIQNDDSNQ